MQYQQQSILDKLADLHWTLVDTNTPQSPNNWAWTEVIHLSKYGTSVFLAVEKDPTPGYLGGKFTSGNYDIVAYSEDPTDAASTEIEEISSINLGKGWEEEAARFITEIEAFKHR